MEAIGNCGRAVDTIVITSGAQPVDLGRDTVICGTIDRVLDPGEGFTSYEWQDGSTSRTYRARAPGLYQVRARTGECEAIGTIRIEAGELITGTLSLAELAPVKLAPVKLAPVKLAPHSDLVVPLRLIPAQGRASLTGRRYRASIRFNATLLLPVGETPLGSIHDGDRIIDIGGTIGESDTLGLLRFVVLLGDSDRTSLTIDSLWQEGECMGDFARESGSIEIELCETTGPRLIDVRGHAGLKVRGGDPRARGITIDYNLIEEGFTRLTLIDALGESVMILRQEDGVAGAHSVSFDAGRLASGLYFIMLETPTEIMVEKVVVRQ